MKRALSIFSFLTAILIPTALFSQKHEGIIKGKVVSSDGVPAVYVSVELKHLKKITFTNEQGVFILSHLPSLQDSLIISSVESQVFGSAVGLQKGQSLDLGTIHLKNNVKELQRVEIMGRYDRSYKSNYSFLGTKTETATKDIPQSISTVTKELIHDKMEFTLKEAVSDVAGINQYSGYDEYTIRGFRAENPRNINGLRGYNTTYTSQMLVNVERVEVIKGPAATLYGNCDPGGTINLVTKKPLDKNEAEVDISAGSWDHWRTQADFTGPMNKSKSLLYRFNAGYDQSHSFRNQFFSRSYQLAPSFSFVPNDKIRINLDFSLSHVRSVLDRGQPGFEDNENLKATPIGLMVTQPGDFLQETSLSSILSFSYKINKHIAFNSGYLNLNTWQGAAEHGIKDYITNDSAHLYYTNWNYNTVTNTVTNYLTIDFNTGKLGHKFLIGYDYVRSRVDLRQTNWELPDQFGIGSGIVGTFSLIHPEYINRPVSTYKESDDSDDANRPDANIYHTQGIYVQEQVSLDRWKLLLGLRREFYKGDNANDSATNLNEGVWLPRIGLVYQLNSNINLYASYNTGFDPFESSGEVQIFKEPFKPITSQLYELGAKGSFFRNKLSATIAVYQLTLQNVAVNANDPSNPDLFVQRGEDQAKGVEFETNGNILPNLSVNFAYAYNVTKITKSELHHDVGKIKENAPRNSSSSWIKYSFNRGSLPGFSLVFGHEQASERNTLVDGFILPGFIIFNAGIQYSFRQFSIFANLNNLANKTYWTSAYNNINKWPGASRNFMVNFGYKF